MVKIIPKDTEPSPVFFQNNNALANYTYNADGLRTSKTVNGVTTNYYWINGILQGQKTGDEYIIFLYDESGTAYGMLVKNGSAETTYYYVRNLQGDIIGILDSTGTQVVSYTYGAWGDVLSVSGTLANTVGQQNPLRYRGYYYDSETGFYYLQSRYYDTVTQRFLNADGFVSTGQGILGNNMFAYCGNNPIMYSDPSGMSTVAIIEEILKELLVVTATFITAAILPTLQKGLNDLGASISAGASVAVDNTKSFLGSFAADYMPSKAKSNAKEKDAVIPNNRKNGITYYHVTTTDNAKSIIASNTLKGSNFESGYIYVFGKIPDTYAILNSGAHFGTVISFKTNAPFTIDLGISNPNVKKFIPLVSVFPGPIKIYDVQIVR